MGNIFRVKHLQTKLLIAFLLAYMPGVFLSSAQAGEEFKQGVKLINERRFAEATKVLKKAVLAEPNNPNALYYLALSWHYQGKTSDALVNYQAILRKFPGTDAGNRAYQAISAMNRPTGTTDAQWYPKAATSSSQGAIGTYSSGSSNASVRSYGSSSNLPEQSTIFFEKGDAGLKVDCFINNRPIKMVFDTGATGIVVGKNQLEEMGIRPPEGAASGQSGGSSNTTLQSFWMMNADVKVGTIVRQNFPIKVLSYNSAPPLLGQSFIQDFEYSIDRNGGVIRLKRKGSGSGGGGSAAHGGYGVPFTWEGPKMLVNVEVNGRPYPMYFDTGNSASAVSFGMDDLKALNITPDDGEAVSTSGVSGSGHGLRFRVKRLKLGPIEKYDIPVIANYQSMGRPLVGQDLYEGFEYTVDNDAKMIRFIRR